MKTTNDTKEHYKSQSSARIAIRRAIENGLLVRPSRCELCKSKPTPQKINCIDGRILNKSGIMAHHYNGYDKPLDVWWVCHSCNSKMRGERFHSGIMTLEDARKNLKEY